MNQTRRYIQTSCFLFFVGTQPVSGAGQLRMSTARPFVGSGQVHVMRNVDVQQRRRYTFVNLTSGVASIQFTYCGGVIPEGGRTQLDLQAGGRFEWIHSWGPHGCVYAGLTAPDLLWSNGQGRVTLSTGPDGAPEGTYNIVPRISTITVRRTCAHDTHGDANQFGDIRNHGNFDRRPDEIKVSLPASTDVTIHPLYGEAEAENILNIFRAGEAHPLFGYNTHVGQAAAKTMRTPDTPNGTVDYVVRHSHKVRPPLPHFPWHSGRLKITESSSGRLRIGADEVYWLRDHRAPFNQPGTSEFCWDNDFKDAELVITW